LGVVDEAAEEKTDERPRRRGRGRGRVRKQEPVEEAVDTPPEVEEEGAALHQETEEPDKEDLDTLSDWNVPSWAELIASLYRPDR
jgi:hypothetical protein